MFYFPFIIEILIKTNQFLKVFQFDLLVLLLILSLMISFVSYLFFFKLAKYLRFSSPCSTISAFERSFNPCIFLLVDFWSLSDVSIFFNIFRISFSMISSCFLVCFVVWVLNLIVLLWIEPSYDFPKSSSLRLYLLKLFLLIFFLIIS